MDLWSSLPVDLLPTILGQLVRRKDLWSAALVNRQFNEVAVPLLYREIRLFGRDLTIVPLLFRELTLSPRLCRLIRRFEVRVYPLSSILKERLAVEQQAVIILKQTTSLQELLWTRQGSLTDRVLEAIVELPNLRSFEINAHTNLQPGSWSAELLTKLPKLRRLALIMPDRKVASFLPSILAQQAAPDEHDGPLLEEFTILSRESLSINDQVIRACAPFLASLKTLALAGCTKLGDEPLLALVASLPRLQHLAIEASSITPTFFLDATRHLSQLVSLKLTHPGPRHPTLPKFWPNVISLLKSTPNLRAFTVYHSGTTGATGLREWPVIDRSLLEDLAGSLGSQLHKLEISGILMSYSSVPTLTEGFPELRDLVTHLGHAAFDPVFIGSALANLTHLRTLHIQCQYQVPFADMVEISQLCSPTLRQIGLRNQVWLIRRETTAEGESKIRKFVESAEAFGIFRRGKYGAEDDALSDEDEEEE